MTDPDFQSLPPRLLRYRALDARVLTFIRDHRHYFQSPLQFNDPYDCDLDAIVPGTSEEYERQCRTYADELERRYYKYGQLCAHISTVASFEFSYTADAVFPVLQSLTNHAARQLRTLDTSPEQCWQTMRSLIGDSYGLLCFSASDDNMLLWSHYANGHRGLCLAFDTSERPICGWKHWRFLKVRYRDTRRVDVGEIGFAEGFEQLLTTKGQQWAYEQEYRLLTLLGSGFQQGRCASLGGIVLGTRVRDNSEEARTGLYASLAELKIRRRPIRALELYQAQKVPGEYRLRIVPIAWDQLPDALGLS